MLLLLPSFSMQEWPQEQRTPVMRNEGFFCFPCTKLTRVKFAWLFQL